MCSKLIVKIFALWALFFALCANAVPMCPLNLPEGPIVIYEDQLSDGWNKDWSWATKVEEQWAPGGQNGSYAMKVIYGSAWQGLELHRNNFPTLGKTALSFRIMKAQAQGDIFVRLRDANGGDNHFVPVSSYLSSNQSTTFVAGQWYSINIPLADFGMQGVPLSGIIFQSDTAGTAYVDNVMITEAFKLPLPGGKNWLLTTEVGDGGCTAASSPLPSHTGNNYFSLDFDNTSQTGGEESNVPVLAMAGGKVLFAGFISDTLERCNGYHVVINHDYNGNTSTGISTRYLHLVAGSITVKKDDIVSQGEKLGTLGDTGSGLSGCGSPWGTHSHIGFRFNGNGSSDIFSLQNITMEGRKLSDYTATCSGGESNKIFSLKQHTKIISSFVLC